MTFIDSFNLSYLIYSHSTELFHLQCWSSDIHQFKIISILHIILQFSLDKMKTHIQEQELRKFISILGMNFIWLQRNMNNIRFFLFILWINFTFYLVKNALDMVQQRAVCECVNAFELNCHDHGQCKTMFIFIYFIFYFKWMLLLYSRKNIWVPTYKTNKKSFFALQWLREMNTFRVLRFYVFTFITFNVKFI